MLRVVTYVQEQVQQFLNKGSFANCIFQNISDFSFPSSLATSKLSIRGHPFVYAGETGNVCHVGTRLQSFVTRESELLSNAEHYPVHDLNGERVIELVNVIIIIIIIGISFMQGIYTYS